MRGHEISELQMSLKVLGYYQESVNGIFTPATQAAVKAFQESAGQPGDGVVDKHLWRSLNSIPAGDQEHLAESGMPSITIDVDRKILLFESNTFARTYPVAVGKPLTPTPQGNWTIIQKALNPGGPFGVRWMRLSVPWGGFGIHGNNRPSSIGTRASHGCVRMYNTDVIEIYNYTPIGTPVLIIGKSYANRIMKLGVNGADVKEVQMMLNKLGYRINRDGQFGPQTERVVWAFQKDQGLTADGIVNPYTIFVLQKACAKSRRTARLSG